MIWLLDGLRKFCKLGSIVANNWNLPFKLSRLARSVALCTARRSGAALRIRLYKKRMSFFKA